MNLKLLSFFILCSFFVLAVCFVIDVQAVTVTFADIDVLGTKKILVYNHTGGFVGEFNTTDTIDLNDNDSYVFLFKPSIQESYFNDPIYTMVDIAKANFPVIAMSLLYVGFIVGVVLVFARSVK